MIALRAYFDSSGKLEDDYITLAGVAANGQMWDEFDREWKRILDAHTPKAQYVHMAEICHQNKAFDRSLGWDDKTAFSLSNNCLVYMSHLDKKRFRVFYCSIDLRAWRVLRSETYQLPDPVEMCNKFCAETVLGWYLHHYPDVIDPHSDKVAYFFDRGEYFYHPFRKKWEAEKNRAARSHLWSVWPAIEQVSSVDMKTTPGIQAADIIAWAMNRETFAKEGEKARYLGHIIRQVIPSFYVIWDESRMRQEFTPLLYRART